RSGGSLRGRLLVAVGGSLPRVLAGAVRPGEHGPGGLERRARPPVRDHGPAGRADLAPVLPRRPDPRRAGAPVVDLVEPRDAARGAGGGGCDRRPPRVPAPPALAPRRPRGRPVLRPLPPLPPPPLGARPPGPPPRPRPAP